MKKFITLLLLLSVAIVANAQDRKSWGMKNGLSEATKSDCLADPTNWTVNRTDADGVAYGWKNAVSMSGELKANGTPIVELQGLSFAGLGSGQLLLDLNTFRVSKAANIITLPKLVNGQKVSITARSANATATDRGFKGNDNMTYIEGPDGGIILGRDAGGTADGFQTLVWEVTTESTDSVDIVITPITGGLDIQSIVIDDGDSPIVGNISVGYIYNSADGYSYDNDLLPQLFAGTLEITPVDLASTDIQRDSLYGFDALMINSTVKGIESLMNDCREIIGFVPIVNMSADMFKTWEMGTSETLEGTMDVPVELQANPLFENVSNFDFMLAKMQSFNYADKFAVMSDTVFATVNGSPVISRWAPKRNDLIFVGADINDINEALMLGSEIYTMLANAANIVAANKKDPAKAGTPAFSQTYSDGKTTVKLSCSTKNNYMFYTLDGTEPDFNSTPYTNELTFTSDATIKAISYALGYYPSNVASADVVIKNQAQKPEITFVRELGKTTITISSAGDATTYYGFMDSKSACGVYTEPIVMTEPATIYAYSVGDGILDSEMASLAFGVDGVDATNIRLDTLGHFDSNQTDWWWETTGGSSKVAYYIGKSTPETNFDTDSLFFAGHATEPSETTPWVVKTAGQVMQWENTTPTNAVYVGEAGYYCDAPEDLITTPTKYHITFGGKPSGFDYSGRIESTKKFRAPFDVITFVGCNNGSATGFNFEVQVSADGENWTAVGDSLTFALTQRIWKRNVRHYEGTDEVYVRVAQLAGSSKAAVYDIFVMNNGEISKQYVDPQSVVGKKGDANNDNQIDVADITTIAAYILDNSKVPASLDNADANSDGKIDVADITTVAGMILGNS